MTDPKDNAFQEGMFGKTNTLTKREYFAAIAYQALLTAHYSSEDSEYSANDMQIALLAVQQADTLISALNMKKSEES